MIGSESTNGVSNEIPSHHTICSNSNQDEGLNLISVVGSELVPKVSKVFVNIMEAK